MEDKKIKEELETLEEEKKQDSKVLIDKEKFEQLMEKVNTLESALKGVTEVEDEQAKNLTALVRFIDGKAVVGYGNSYEKRSADGRKFLMLEVITIDEKVHEVEYLPFMNQGEQEKVEIISKVEKPDIIKFEKIYKTEYDYQNFKNTVTDKLVDLQVEIPNTLYTVKLKNGKEIILPEKALN